MRSLDGVRSLTDSVARAWRTSEYLIFDRTDVPRRKTPIITVISKGGGYALGYIKWFGRWRQFCFFPRHHTIFNRQCMQDIQDVIDELHKERARARS